MREQIKDAIRKHVRAQFNRWGGCDFIPATLDAAADEIIALQCSTPADEAPGTTQNPIPPPSDKDGWPIPMVLHCPKCGLQHIDAPADPEFGEEGRPIHWSNPPHRSHLCSGCGHIWRPADVPTEGVAAIKTRGKADCPPTDKDALSGEELYHGPFSPGWLAKDGQKARERIEQWSGSRPDKDALSLMVEEVAAPFGKVLAWFKTLPLAARQQLSLKNLHDLSKALTPVDRSGGPTQEGE